MVTDDQEVSVVSSELKKKESRLPSGSSSVYTDGRRDERCFLINGKKVEIPNRPLMLEMKVELYFPWYLADRRQLLCKVFCLARLTLYSSSG